MLGGMIGPRIEVELFIPRDFSTFTTDDQLHVVRAIAELLKTTHDVRIVRIKPGVTPVLQRTVHLRR